MLLYQYPPKIDKRTAQLIEFNAVAERKKVKKNSVKNVVMGVIITLLAIFIPNVVVKIFVFLVAASSFFTAYLLYKSAREINGKNNWTKIYDDHIEHSQTGVFTEKVTEFYVSYSDIIESSQNSVGELVLKLKEGNAAVVKVKNEKGETDAEIKDNTVSLSFINSKPKFYLINNLYENIKYPKKNYIPYEEDDEDDKDFHF